MANCVNYKNKDVVALAEELGLHPVIAAAKIATWQDTNGVDKWPTAESLKTKDISLQQEKKFLTTTDNKELYKDNNLLNQYGEAKFFSNKKVADRFAEDLNNKATMQDYEFSVRTASTATKDGWKILMSKKAVENDGQTSFDFQKKNSLVDMFNGNNPIDTSNVIGEEAPKIFKTPNNEVNEKVFGQVNRLSSADPESKMAVYAFASDLAKRTGVDFQTISPEDASKFEGYEEGAPGFYDHDNKTAYLVDGIADGTTAVHEVFGHPFLDMLKSDPELKPIYDSLLEQAKSVEGLEDEVRSDYAKNNYSPERLNDEIINRSLDNHSKGLLDSEQHKGLLDALQSYFKAFTDTIKRVLGIRTDLVHTLSKDTTIGELSNWALYGEGAMRILGQDKEREDIIGSLHAVLDMGDDKFNKMYEGMPIGEFVDSFNFGRKESELLKDWITENNPASVDDLVKGVLNDLQRKPQDIETQGFISLAKAGEKATVLRGDMMDEAIKAKESYISGLLSRAQALARDPDSTKAERDDLDFITRDINNSDETLSAIKFMKYAKEQGLANERSLDTMTTDMNNGLLVDTKKLMDTYTNFVKMFNTAIDAVSQIADNSESIFNKYADKNAIVKFKEDISASKKAFADLNDKFNPLLKYAVTNEYDRIALGMGSTTRAELTKDIYNLKRDVSGISLWVGQPSMSRVEQIRALDKLLTDIHAQTRYDLNNSGYIPKLQRLANQFSGGGGYVNFMKFYEQHNRKYTGYLLSKLKYGVLNAEYSKFKKDLAKEFDLKNEYQMPLDPEEYSRYIAKKDAFLSQHVERMFTPDYYKLKHSLSPITSDALDDASSKIASITDKYKNEYGVTDVSKMPLEDRERLFAYRKEKEFLASDRYQGTGETKIGKDLQIAQEIQKYNEKVKEKLQYKTNQTKFDEARLQMKKDLSPESYMDWIKSNTKVQYKQEFWDKLSSLEKADQTPEWQALYDQKQSVLKAFRDSDSMETRVDRLESQRIQGKSAKQWLDETDLLLNKYKNKLKPDPDTISFKKIADLVQTDQYKREYAKYDEMRTKGNENEQDIANAWFYDNHNENKNGELNPKSYWLKLEPKDKSLIERNIPTSAWSELDQNSEFYNKKYDPTLKEFGMQPKKELYDNGREFDKLMNKPSQKEFYDTILQMKREGDSMYNYAENQNPLRMPQIYGNSLRRITRENNLFKGIGNELKQMFVVRTDQSEYGGDVEKMFNPDNSATKYVPTFYKRMLDNPNAISKDMLHSYVLYHTAALNYKNQMDHFYDVQAILEGLNRTSISNKEDLRNSNKPINRTDVNSVQAGKTNVVKRAEGMVDRLVYGNRSSKLTVKIPGTDISIDVAKPLRGILSWFRGVTLSWNPLVAASNFAISELGATMESSIGVNINKADWTKANLEYMKMLPEAMLSLTKRRFNNKLVSIMRLFDISANEAAATKGTSGIQAINYAKEHFAYGMYTVGDFTVKSRITAAMLMGYKLNGDTFQNRHDFITNFLKSNENASRKDALKMFNALPVNLYDAFEMDKDSGQLRINPLYENAANNQKLADVNLSIRTVADKLHGMLSPSDRNVVNTNALTSAFVMYRGWLVTTIADRFGGKMFSYTKGREDEGQYRTFFASEAGYQGLLNAMTFGVIKPLRDKVGRMDTYQVYNIQKTINEVKYMVGTALLCSLIKPNIRDKDKDKPSLGSIAYITAMRTLYQMNASAIPIDAFGIIKSPTAAQSQLDLLFNISDGLLTGKLTDVVASGKYKGKTHLQEILSKLTPGYKGVYENFLHPDLEAKEKYMNKNMGPIWPIFGPADPSLAKVKKRRTAKAKKFSFL